MESDIKAALQEIVAELRATNDIQRASVARGEEMRKALEAKRERLGIEADPTARIKAMQEMSEERIGKLRKDSDQRRDERNKFEADLVGELRRLNANFETFLGSREGL